MGKIYTNPFDWGYADDNTLIYVDTSEEGIKSMINQALDDALDDVKDEIVDETMSSMDIKLEGENLLYKLIVNGNENGEINIPKDQFLKSTTYDSENKKLIFVMQTTDGESTIEVSISDLVASIEEKNQEQDVVLAEKADKSELVPLAVKSEVESALAEKADTSTLEAFATKEEVAAAVAPLAVKAEVTEEINSAVDGLNAALADKADASALETLATKAEVEAVDTKVEAIEVPSIEGLAKTEDVTAEIAAAVEPLATKEEVANKVDWVESTPDRKHIVLKNHDSVLGTATDGTTYNVAMVSKWDVADFGSAQLHLNLNSKDGVATINDDKVIATKDEVEAVDAKVNAIDLTPFAKTEDMNAAVEALNAKDAELEAAIPQAAANAVAQVVANAPEDLDTLKEVADYIAADKTKATEIENKLAELAAKDADLVAKDSAQDTVINGKVDRNMNGANGKALIFNESDGGGAKFEHNDGTWSFAGVNDGGENGIAGQVYAIKKNTDGKMEGTRIDVTKDAMYYTVGAASAAERMVAGNEIAVKGDIDAAVAPLAVKTDVDTALETKADADKVYTQNEVNNMLAEKQAEIDTMVADFKKLKEIVGDLGGAVEYSVPADGKLTDMLKKSGVIKLTEDVESNTYTGGITSKNITTLNLGGKTITTVASTTTNPSIMVRGTQQFTITGSGTLNANGHIAIEANGEDAVITLGGTAFGKPTYVTNREGELIYCYLGTINITNGVFRNDNENKAFLLNCYDANYRNGTAKIVVTGGKFYDFDPANNASEGEGTSYVPEGYVSVASTETIDGVEHTVYTVKTA